MNITVNVFILVSMHNMLSQFIFIQHGARFPEPVPEPGTQEYDIADKWDSVELSHGENIMHGTES